MRTQNMAGETHEARCISSRQWWLIGYPPPGGGADFEFVFFFVRLEFSNLPYWTNDLSDWFLSKIENPILLNFT
jgi:hypothetical protein